MKSWKGRASMTWGVVHLTIGLRVSLGRIPNQNHLALGEPRVNLSYAARLVFLGPKCQRRQQSCHGAPARVPQDEGAMRVPLMAELSEKRVQIVGRGGEIEPGRRLWKGGRGVSAELWHAWYGRGGIDKGLDKDAERISRLSDFDGVVDVCEDQGSVSAKTRCIA